jgi:hypothetical protein
MANGEWSARKQNDVGFRLSAGLVNTVIKYAERNLHDPAAQRLAGELSDALTTYRREAARDAAKS